MRQKIARFGFLATILGIGVFSAVLAQPRTAKSADELQVLFIGNSLTFGHDLPDLVAQLAKAGKQRPLHCERETPGGCTLEKHWRDGKALTKIKSRHWDFVVLQDESRAPVQRRNLLFEYAKKFDAEIKKQKAKTLLYMTWAWKGESADQPIVSKAYLDLAKETKAAIAPVGLAWERAFQADKNLVLHEPDRNHANLTGAYLAACVFYGTIYGQSPEGLPGDIGKLTDEEAKRLQKVAWKVVQETNK